ncbi:MAG: valine--tRNA ligase [Patescibacteria group bacterium]
MLPKAYAPKAVEDRIYALWENSGAFRADVKSTKKPFTIAMPPPNATGQLHLGHAVMLALEDIFIRFNRMRGKEALWIPGTDHAAIATESVVIKEIQKKEKIPDPRAKLGREKLVQRIAEFVEKSRGVIRSQVRKMGASCDWTRERYTMDPMLNRCVNEVFAKMYKDGLIYRAERVVNWDTALQTTISDDEIEYVDQEATLYTIEYVGAKQTGGKPILVSTSRPETKLGDSALAVHPDDERFKHLIGKTFDVVWPRGQTIRVSVIADHLIDPAFGTGVLGLTSFHSKIDYEIWQRHRTEIPSYPLHVIGEDGRITDQIKGYAGMKALEAREAFVEDLKKEGRIAKEEKYVQPLSISYRSKKPVEPLPKLQWFIDVNKRVVSYRGKQMSLREILQHVIRAGEIKIIPSLFEKTYFQWIDHLQDWCISRQIWWGHRVPVYYCSTCKNPDGTPLELISVSTEPYTVHELCGSRVEQDPDTLDTWFSSALWTWSTLADPSLADDFSLSLEEILKRSPDFQKFHPTQVMETGYDILFFWVARMILMTTYAVGDIPFETVYLHGLIRTREGKKMSKSDPETMIDPLDIIPKYGADALRLSMILGQSPGNDSRLYEEKIAGYRNFVNKLWNASRFVLMQCDEAKIDPKTIAKLPDSSALALPDRAILSRLQSIVEKVTKGLEEYRLSEVGDTLYSFVWDDFCDWYLELSKGNANTAVLVHTLRKILQLIHPYCPFVTEELWSHVKPADAGLLIARPWPETKEALRNEESEKQFLSLIGVIQSIRKLRADQGIEPAKKLHVVLSSKKHAKLFEEQREHIERMARVEKLEITGKKVKPANVVSAFLPETEVYLSLEGLIDKAKEIERLKKEKDQAEKFLHAIEAKLQDKQFTGNAPSKVIEMGREKQATTKAKLEKIEKQLKALS